MSCECRFFELTSSLGPWTKEEEEQLIRIVTKMTVEQGKDIDNEVFWGRVSEEMGGKRGRQQCRIKWYVGLCSDEAWAHSWIILKDRCAEQDREKRSERRHRD